MKIRRYLTIVAVSFVVLPAIAGEGRIPIPFQAPVNFPIVISSPGKYVLTRDLAGPGNGAPVIEIDSPDVEIDLNGKVILNGEPGIRINLLAEAKIRNGAIEGGDIGIHGVTGLNDVVIEDVHFSDMTSQAILLNDPDAYVIRRCIIEDLSQLTLADETIEVAAGSNSQGTVESNIFRRSTGAAIRILGGGGVVIRDNRFREVDYSCIHLTGDETGFNALISGNTLKDCGVSGITFSGGGAKVINNLVLNNIGVGIYVQSDGNLILDNVVRGSTSDGIQVIGGGNQIVGNVLTSNGTGGNGYGLRFQTGSAENTFGRNTAYSNAGGPCANPLAGLDDLCDETAPPGTNNYSFGDNLMPPSSGLF